MEADVIFHGTNTNISIYFRNIYDLPKISSGCLVDITNETPSATVSAFVDNNLVKLVKEDLARVSLKGQLNEKHLKEVPDKKYKSILMQYQLSGPPTGFSTMDYYSP